jgi:hypothetical protein
MTKKYDKLSEIQKDWKLLLQSHHIEDVTIGIDTGQQDEGLIFLNCTGMGLSPDGKSLLLVASDGEHMPGCPNCKESAHA